MSDIKHPFVMFPTRIWNLPGITLQLLKFYEKIFQFWHQGHECFIGNKALMEYAGMKSDSTVRDAFTFFEQCGEMKRVMKNGKRYIIPPQPKLMTDSVDNFSGNSTNNNQTSAVALGDQRCGAGGTSAVALPNNINIIKEINKSFCVSREEQKKRNEKKHSWADKKSDAPMADVTKQSTSYDPAKMNTTVPPSALLAEYMNKNKSIPLQQSSNNLPRSLRRMVKNLVKRVN